MIILIAGGTGFVGRELIKALLAKQHKIFVLGREISKIKSQFHDQVTPISWQDLDATDPDVDAVINLCGANISQSRWTDHIKRIIIDSRVNTSLKLASWCARASNPPRLLNASAVGIYGSYSGDHTAFTEKSPIHKNTSFLSQVGQAWESAALSEQSVRVTLMRFGVVLKRGEGLLKKLSPSFSFGFGGTIGHGEQIISWIDIHDLIAAIEFILKNNIIGPVNVCAPTPIVQKDFAKTLASVMHRPSFLTTPSWMVRMLFGELADELLLSGQKVIPERLTELGFNFKYDTLNKALSQYW
jgi:uncharacterized protein (TIGR01777 family)